MVKITGHFLFTVLSAPSSLLEMVIFISCVTTALCKMRKEGPMNINQLRQFVSVARHGSMTKAASELYMTQQALSKTMQLLQDELGCQLFTRTSHGVQLTSFGNHIFGIALSMVQNYDSCSELIYRLAAQNRAQLTICYEHSMMPWAIPKELSARFNTSSLFANDVFDCIRQVQSGKADIGLCTYMEHMDGLKFFRLISEPILFLMDRNHPLAQKDILTLQDIRDIPQNMPNVRGVTILQYINACMSEGFYPNFVYESQDFGMLSRSLVGSDRILLCDSFVRTAIEENQLTLVPLNHKTLWKEMGFIAREKDLNDRTVNFIDSVRDYYKERTLG